jgi:hemoglobin
MFCDKCYTTISPGATTTTMSGYHHSADDVPNGLSIPRWSWDGRQD